MAIKISALPEETVVTDNDVVAVVDVETTTTKKSKVTTFFNWLLGRANTWTKSQTIITDGTTAPLTIRNSTNTADDFKVLNKSVWANGGGNVSTNTAYGQDALRLNSTGQNNTSFGQSSLYSCTTSSGNSAFGRASLNAIGTSSNNNSSVGTDSGRYIADGTTALTQANQSLFLGAFTKSLAQNQTNEIVIGYNAIGKGTNSVVLGNDSIVNTWLKGVVNLVKQLRIVSDGTNSPLVVRDSTDTRTLYEVDATGTYYNYDSASSNIISVYKQNGAVKGREYYNSSGIKVYEWDTFQFRNRANVVVYIQNANGERLITYDTVGTQQPRSGSIQTIIGSTLQEQTYSGVDQNSSSIFELRSTTKGFLPPRMTTTERNAIATPAEGLMVYDTTVKGWFGYDGTNWIQL